MRDELLDQVRAGPRPGPGGAVLVARAERGGAGLRPRRPSCSAAGSSTCRTWPSCARAGWSGAASRGRLGRCRALAGPGRCASAQDDRLTLEYTGPLPALLAWLARQPLADLRLEPLGLGAIYHRYHGGRGMTLHAGPQAAARRPRWLLVVVALLLAAFQCLWAKITAAHPRRAVAVLHAAGRRSAASPQRHSGADLSRARARSSRR